MRIILIQVLWSPWSKLKESSAISASQDELGHKNYLLCLIVNAPSCLISYLLLGESCSNTVITDYTMLIKSCLY